MHTRYSYLQSLWYHPHFFVRIRLINLHIGLANGVRLSPHIYRCRRGSITNINKPLYDWNARDSTFYNTIIYYRLLQWAHSTFCLFEFVLNMFDVKPFKWKCTHWTFNTILAKWPLTTYNIQHVKKHVAHNISKSMLHTTYFQCNHRGQTLKFENKHSCLYIKYHIKYTPYASSAKHALSYSSTFAEHRRVEKQLLIRFINILWYEYVLWFAIWIHLTILRINIHKSNKLCKIESKT